MRLAIIGGRNFNDFKKLEEVLHTFYWKYPTFRFEQIVSGGAIGADKLGARFAKEYKIDLKEFIPDWDKHGKAAGFIRNEDIIKNSDEVLAFWDSVSRGTANSLSIAKRLKKPTLVIYF